MWHSSRFKGGNISSYFYIKAIAEELQGLIIEFEITYIHSNTNNKKWFRIY